MESMGARSSNELQWFDLKIGHQEWTPSYIHQGNMPYYTKEWMMVEEWQWKASCILITTGSANGLLASPKLAYISRHQRLQPSKSI